MKTYRYGMTIQNDPAFGEAIFDLKSLREQMLESLPESETHLDIWLNELNTSGNGTLYLGDNQLHFKAYLLQ